MRTQQKIFAFFHALAALPRLLAAPLAHLALRGVWAVLVVGGGAVVVGCGSKPARSPSDGPAGTALAPVTPEDALPTRFLKRSERQALERERTAIARRAEQARLDQAVRAATGEANGTAPVRGSEAQAPQRTWSVLLGSFEGEQARATAQRALMAARAGGVPDVRIDEPSTGALALRAGPYLGPDDPRARAALRAAQELEIDGVRPFGQALLLPDEDASTAATDPAALPEEDLRSVRARLGPRAVYTLQVGIYRRLDDAQGGISAQELATIRKAAEEAVRALRARGEEAFYYHSEQSSSVTVGVFGEEDVVMQEPDELGRMRPLPQPRQSPRLLAVRATHPHNLVNGQGVATRRTGATGPSQLQPSFLVKIPER